MKRLRSEEKWSLIGEIIGVTIGAGLIGAFWVKLIIEVFFQ